MDQITVPQFIENEDRIMGPITVRQFIIILIAGIIIFIAYKLAELPVFVAVAILVGGSSAVLAFYRVNGQPFHFFILNIFKVSKSPSLRVWRKDPKFSFLPNAAEEIDFDENEFTTKPHMAEQHLSQLSLIVDTGGAFHEDTDRSTELF